MDNKYNIWHGNNKTKEEIRRRIEKQIADNKARIPDAIALTKDYIVPGRLEEWEKHLEDYAIEFFEKIANIMKQLHEGETFENIFQQIKVGENGYSEPIVYYLLRVTERGPDFYRFVREKYGKLTEKDIAYVERMKKENILLKSREEKSSQRAEEQTIIESETLISKHTEKKGQNIGEN